MHTRDTVPQFQSQLILLLQVGLARAHAGIHLDFKRSGVLLSTYGQSDLILSRRNHWSSRLRLHNEDARDRLRTIHSQIPHVAIHSLIGAQCAFLTRPSASPAFIAGRRTLLILDFGAGDVMQHLPVRIKNVQRYWLGWSLLYVVVKHRTSGRVLS